MGLVEYFDNLGFSCFSFFIDMNAGSESEMMMNWLEFLSDMSQAKSTALKFSTKYR